MTEKLLHDVSVVWFNVVDGLRARAADMRRLGEERQAEALEADANSMQRRQQLHLRSIAARPAQLPEGGATP